jgi:hypothetical protein
LSAPCSNSPALRLEVVESRLYRLAHGLFCLFAAACLWRLQQLGYPLLALSLLAPVAWCCRRLQHQPLAGSVVRWSAGGWALQRRGSLLPIALDRSSRCMGALVYLAWRGSGGGERGACLLFPDSARPEQLRLLRARINLQR